jgi:hypothetical protein
MDVVVRRRWRVRRILHSQDGEEGEEEMESEEVGEEEMESESEGEEEMDIEEQDE